MNEKYIKHYGRLLEGERVFVSTAARGIGKSIALLFARQGAIVYFAGRNGEKAKETEQELQTYSPLCRSYVCDLGNETQTEETAERVLADSGGIDILVNTVGVNRHYGKDRPYDDALFLDEDLFRLIETNYISGLRFARTFLPGMKKRMHGNIINISSIHSIMTQPDNMLYAGTKGAVNAAARAMAMDCAPYGIRVNTICPGLILSDIFQDEYDLLKTRDEQAAFFEHCRRCQPLPSGCMEDIANAALFFASAMSSYITGQALLVDGGTSIKAHDFFPDAPDGSRAW